MNWKITCLIKTNKIFTWQEPFFEFVSFEFFVCKKWYPAYIYYPRMIIIVWWDPYPREIARRVIFGVALNGNLRSEFRRRLYSLQFFTREKPLQLRWNYDYDHNNSEGWKKNAEQLMPLRSFVCLRYTK